MLALLLSLSISFGSDTIIKLPTSEIRYLMPCTWRCSCNWNKVHKGWMVLYKGKTYNVEGDRKDGKSTPTMFCNPNNK